MWIPYLMLVVACWGIPFVLAEEVAPTEPQPANAATVEPPPLQQLLQTREADFADHIGDCVCHHRREDVAFNGKRLTWKEATDRYRETCYFLLLGYYMPPEGLAMLDRSMPYRFGDAITNCVCDEMDKHVPATGAMDPEKMVRNPGYLSSRSDDPLEQGVRRQCENKAYQALRSATAAVAKKDQRRSGTTQTEKNNLLKINSIDPETMFQSVKDAMSKSYQGIKGINPAALARAATRAPRYVKMPARVPVIL